jgi:hypothetical protein
MTGVMPGLPATVEAHRAATSGLTVPTLVVFGRQNRPWTEHLGRICPDDPSSEIGAQLSDPSDPGPRRTADASG